MALGLRSMAAAPELAPPDQNHILRTSSAVRAVDYGDDASAYEKVRRRLPGAAAAGC